jgi:hypothetical protein
MLFLDSDAGIPGSLEEEKEAMPARDNGYGDPWRIEGTVVIRVRPRGIFVKPRPMVIAPMAAMIDVSPVFVGISGCGEGQGGRKDQPKEDCMDGFHYG